MADELQGMTVSKIKKELKFDSDKFNHMATQIKTKSNAIPKSRRCETCLSYTETTIPCIIELCKKCVDKLVGRTEKQYVPQISMKRFVCDHCGEVSIWKTIINPVVCHKCMRVVLNRFKELREKRLMAQEQAQSIVVKRK